jgi:NAD-dependent SIR2 family protein deacetylase
VTTQYLAETRRLRYERIVLLLGAGASYDHGYPLVGEFLSPQYYRWLFDECAAMPASFGDAKLDYFLAAIDRYRGVASNFEEVLSQVYGQEEPYAELVEFVCRTLHLGYELKLYSQVGSTAEFLGLASMILEHRAEGDVAVVTFNYDTSVEEALSAVSDMLASRWAKDRLFFNYGFRQPVQSTVPADLLNWASRLPNKYPAGRVSILKPHGSANLLHCEACGATVYFPFQALARGLADPFAERCPTCSAPRLQRLIVPPGKRKQIPPALEQVWLAAEAALASADFVVIAGYSMPAYDIEARELVGRTLHGKGVLYVDPTPSADAVAFLRGIPGARVEVMAATATAFLQSELDRYDTRLRSTFEPLCSIEYLYPELREGHPRSGAASIRQ